MWISCTLLAWCHRASYWNSLDKCKWRILFWITKCFVYYRQTTFIHQTAKCIGQVRRSIKDRKNWKASNWLAWILFYAVPCLKRLLPEKHLNHLSMFSTAITSLLNESITKNMLESSKKLFIKYVFYFGEFFGTSKMNYNVHLMLHVPVTVENWGPLWADNTFPFENENKNLL